MRSGEYVREKIATNFINSIEYTQEDEGCFHGFRIHSNSIRKYLNLTHSLHAQ